MVNWRREGLDLFHIFLLGGDGALRWLGRASMDGQDGIGFTKLRAGHLSLGLAADGLGVLVSRFVETRIYVVSMTAGSNHQ